MSRRLPFEPDRRERRIPFPLQDPTRGARVWAGFHFRHSDQAGAALGRKVARYVTQRFFEQRAKRAGRG